MNKGAIIKLTNKIALIAPLLLLYGVFILMISTVFDFKVFKEKITEPFYLSSMGILAITVCVIIVNIMFNLTTLSGLALYGLSAIRTVRIITRGCKRALIAQLYHALSSSG